MTCINIRFETAALGRQINQTEMGFCGIRNLLTRFLIFKKKGKETGLI